MIEIDGVELRTAAQWEKKYRHVKKGQLGKGVERTWRSPNGNTTAMFYNIEQTRPWAKKDVEAVNRRRRADAKAKREADECGRIEGAARAEQHRKDLLDCWGAHIDEETLQEGRRDHTAYQWCDLGFVPIAEARWRLTETVVKPLVSTTGSVNALPGMCAMTQTAPRSCWRRGRASTTGCPTVVRTMGVRGGKRKNGEGQNPSPLRQQCRPAYLRVL